MCFISAEDPQRHLRALSFGAQDAEGKVLPVEIFQPPLAVLQSQVFFSEQRTVGRQRHAR